MANKIDKVCLTPSDPIATPSLAEFGSVVDAVQCAVVIRTTLRAENANLPQNRRMEFRIGINLGDVMRNYSVEVTYKSIDHWRHIL